MGVFVGVSTSTSAPISAETFALAERKHHLMLAHSANRGYGKCYSQSVGALIRETSTSSLGRSQARGVGKDVELRVQASGIGRDSTDVVLVRVEDVVLGEVLSIGSIGVRIGDTAG